MNWKKSILLVLAGLVILVSVIFVVNGIKMVTANQPGHTDFTEGLMLLIPGALMLVAAPLITWRMFSLDWFQIKIDGDLCCPECGYNMAGLSATKCPECGNEFTIDQLKHS